MNEPKYEIGDRHEQEFEDWENDMCPDCEEAYMEYCEGEEDALCLADSYFDDRFIDSNGSKRFLPYYYGQDKIIANVRELFLEKEQLQKLRTGLIAQLRQRLSFEYPEGAGVTLNISPVRGFTPFIGWLACIDVDKRYEKNISYQ